MQEIVDLEIVLVSLSERVKKIELDKPLFGKCILYWLNRKLNKLKSKQFQNIESYLYATSENYRVLADKNLELLKSDEIDFVVYENSYPLLDRNIEKLEGNIHDNGFSYSNSVMKGFFVLKQIGYVIEFCGKIDYWGNLKLKPVKTKSDYFKTFPKRFRGVINSKGEVNIQCIEKEIDIFNKSVTIGKVIANHFGGDDIRKQQFISNKHKLMDFVNELRTELNLSS